MMKTVEQVGEEVEEEGMMERQVQIWVFLISLSSNFFFEEIRLMFFQIILGNKILELLLNKIKRDFRIDKLEKEKER